MPAAQIAAPAPRNITASSHTGDPLTTQFSDRGSEAIAHLAHRRTRRATRRHARSPSALPSWRFGSPAHPSVLTVSKRVWAFTPDGDDGLRVRRDDLVGRVQHRAYVAGRYDRGAGGVGEDVVAGTDRHPGDNDRTVRLVRGDGVAAPPRCFASAIDGEVVEFELGEVAQPTVRENAGEPMVSNTRQLCPTAQ